MLEKKNPATPLAKAAGLGIVDQRAADDIRAFSTLARLREDHLVVRCGIRPAIAGVVATLVYGETRA